MEVREGRPDRCDGSNETHTTDGLRVADDVIGNELVGDVERSLPPPEHGLTTALFIDDVETKSARYRQNIAEGRTALALMSCTAV